MQLSNKDKKRSKPKLLHTESAPSQAFPLLNQSKLFEEEFDFPRYYHDTKLTLISRDPYWIYAYWEILPATQEKLKKKIGANFDQTALTLRLYDVSYIEFNNHNAHHSFDIDVNPQTDHHYIHVWSDHATFCADLGFRSSSGTFYAIVRSNLVTTQRANPSGRADMFWMKVDPQKKQSRTFFKTRPQNKSLQESAISQNHDFKKQNIQQYFNTSKSLTEAIREGVVLGRHDKNSLKQIIDDPLLIVEGTRDKVLEWNKTVSVDGASERFLLSGASERHYEHPSGASENLSSHVAGSVYETPIENKDFYFEIHTELTVYGRTQPDAMVWFGDRQVPLRDDGTFTLRIALPEDRKIPLRFVAKSGDVLSERTIETFVQRGHNLYVRKDFR